jgi:hypothetical protein
LRAEVAGATSYIFWTLAKQKTQCNNTREITEFDMGDLINSDLKTELTQKTSVYEEKDNSS